MNVFDLIITDKEVVSLEDVFLNKYNHQNIKQLIKEHQYVDELTKYGLPVNNKILLQGHSGCGKTKTAKAIAHSLGKPILILNLSNIVSSRIGETSQNLKQIFDKAAREKAVLFLDEFDQIGKERGNDDKDVGEMRRLVNTIIQLIDYYPANALLIAATNHAEIIDQALLRRFQLRINFEMPNAEVLDKYYDKILRPFPAEMQNFERQYNISFAEAKDYSYTKIKSLLIDKFEQLDKLDQLEKLEKSVE
ncbi:AAA family ATPase [Kaistella jeonii]|uniref:AAA family ATPase n=1 Tax=Kaistella jeonii TaxID=266749 RepID=UPI000689FE8A|nr:ATP-binding protein [Kaistella jeonii]SFB81707.1 ATPase family associated with various cellular activities (AAA) [Kaistella jeonii]VEI96130.1 ATP-dependent zinc metalloprotease FtsH 3 [Kaistella jeonii]